MKKERSSNLAQGIGLLVLFFNICLILFILAPPGHYNLNQIQSNLATETAVTLHGTPKPQEDMVLEWRLVDTINDGEWRVEKYREYEKQLDDKGQVIKETPTDHFNYLRYWRYQ